jgi:hypothetical protein
MRFLREKWCGRRDLNLGSQAWKTTVVSTSSDFYLNLFVQCKKLPGNAWIFFRSPEEENFHSNTLRVMMSDYLNDNRYTSNSIFKEKGTHFDKAEALVASHCEVIVDENLSNKRIDNLWDCQMTLIKAISQEMEKQYLH